MGWGTQFISEPENRPEGQTKIVMCSVVEIDFVAHFEAQAHRTDRGLETGSRVDGSVQRRHPQPEKAADNAIDRKEARTQAKVHDAGCHGIEGMKVSMGGLHFDAE